MSKWRKINQLFGLLLVVLSITLLYLPARAQQTNLVYVCVVPIDQAGVEHEPFIITFRQSQMFGLVIPRDANVTLYGGSSSTLAAGVYSITTDAQTGGYRRQTNIVTAPAGSDVPHSGPEACSEAYPEIITNDLIYTAPMPVSDTSMLIVNPNGQDGIDSQPIAGVFAFHFIPDPGSKTLDDIQVIQLSEGSIDVSFPYLHQDTHYVLIANKGVGIRRSFSPSDAFTSLLIADSRPLFVQDLQRKSLDLFQIMDAGKVKIYPDSGLFSEYPAGGFLKLEMEPDAPNRHFSAGDTIHPLEGTRANYFLLDRPAEVYGALLSPTDTANIAKVDDQGQLRIVDPAGTNEVIIQGWLVESAS